MNAPSSSDARTINLLIGLGLGCLGLALLVGIASPIFFLYFMKGQTIDVSSQPPTIPRGELGAEGSICGGEERFPCNPGQTCKTADADWTKDYGVCVPAPVE